MSEFKTFAQGEFVICLEPVKFFAGKGDPGDRGYKPPSLEDVNYKVAMKNPLDGSMMIVIDQTIIGSTFQNMVGRGGMCTIIKIKGEVEFL